MSSWYDETGIVPESSPESEQESSPNEALEESANVSTPALDANSMMKTPPRKSILRPSGFLTPLSERKKVKFARKSLSLNLTPACSPAYRDRNILREDMANFTFCLENSRESTGARTPVALGVSTIIGKLSPAPGRRSSNGSQLSTNAFDLSKYIDLLVISSPLKKSFSTTSLNRIGLQSTPTRAPSRCASPDVGLYKRKGNFFGTPQPHQ